MTLFLSYSLVVTLLTTSVSFTALADKEDNGAIIGADIGKDLDNNDRRYLEEAQRDSFRRPIGERTEWDGNSYGSRTGARGNFRTTREGELLFLNL